MQHPLRSVRTCRPNEARRPTSAPEVKRRTFQFHFQALALSRLVFLVPPALAAPALELAAAAGICARAWCLCGGGDEERRRTGRQRWRRRPAPLLRTELAGARASPRCRRTSSSTPLVHRQGREEEEEEYDVWAQAVSERDGGGIFVNTETTLLYIRCTWARVYRIGTQWHIFSRRRIVMA